MKHGGLADPSRSLPPRPARRTVSTNRSGSRPSSGIDVRPSAGGSSPTSLCGCQQIRAERTNRLRSIDQPAGSPRSNRDSGTRWHLAASGGLDQPLPGKAPAHFARGAEVLHLGPCFWFNVKHAQADVRRRQGGPRLATGWPRAASRRIIDGAARIRSANGFHGARRRRRPRPPGRVDCTEHRDLVSLCSCRTPITLGAAFAHGPYLYPDTLRDVPGRLAKG